jgi:hypothetical protein
MKKLKLFICLAVVLCTAAQFAGAQTSIQNTSTYGRFKSDADNYIDVNNWADVEMTKWFGYLRMENLNFGAEANDTPTWQSGLALKFPQMYLGFYYNGRFNTGTQNEGTTTTNYLASGGGDKTGPLLTPAGFPAGTYGVIQHQNEFSVLLGVGNNGFRFTLIDNLTTVDIPFWSVGAAGIVFNGTPMPGDSTGNNRGRGGSITPKLQ